MLEDEITIDDCLFSSAATGTLNDERDQFCIKLVSQDENYNVKQERDYLGSSSGSPSSSLSSPEMKDHLGVDLSFSVPFTNHNSFLNSPASSSGSPFGNMFPTTCVQQHSPLPPVSHFSQQGIPQVDAHSCLVANLFPNDISFFDDDRSPSPPTSDRSSPADSVPSMLSYDPMSEMFINGVTNGMTNGLTMAQQQLKSRSKMHEMAVKQRLITDQDPRSQGMVQLSAEERRTLVQEGYQVPTRLPLTKAEEEALKIVRRKIKNKLSAQESRRKRKEYMDTLEQRCQCYYAENIQLKNQMRQLQMANKQMAAQIKKLQLVGVGVAE